MKSFVIHSSKDREQVDEELKKIKNKVEHFESLMLENGGILWKIQSKRKIKQSQLVILFLGETSHTSKYIGWELKTAIKYNKIISIVSLDDNYEMHEALTYKDKYTNRDKYAGRKDTIETLVKYIIDYEKDEYQLFNLVDGDENKDRLFEQYKLFLATSENLIDRRQKISNFYVSANTLIVTMTALLFTLKIELIYKLIIGAFFSVVGGLLSLSWIKILTAYGNLNSSKMKILSMIEKKLPVSLFDSEWTVLNDRLNNKKYIPFTTIEKQIPRTFVFIYCFAILLVLIILIQHNLKGGHTIRKI